MVGLDVKFVELCSYSVGVWEKLDEKRFEFSKDCIHIEIASIFRVCASYFKKEFLKKKSIHIGGTA